ncbi:hypothetical protein SNE40_008879 [Patella caerulea]|uniref:Uncharacterized protein n=1 Tax=Patella caerulea TaxID=87958 RepID=A0AAN8PPB0_PATCE
MGTLNMVEDWSMEEVVLDELGVAERVEVETTTDNGYEADDDEGYPSDEEWMFGDEEWLVWDPFLCETADDMHSWLYEEAFRPNVTSTPARPATPPPACMFEPYSDIETLKSWYQPDSATPPRKRKQFDDDDEDDMRHVRRRLD